MNLNKLKKDDILWLFNHRCKTHHRRYTEHPYCFFLEKPETAPFQERTCYLDIETTGLNANWDYIISYAIKSENDLIGRVLTKKEVLNWDILDKYLMKEFYDEIVEFDRVVVYWGKDRRHDLPFLRTRALKWSVSFPLYRDLFVTDCYDIAKGKLRLHRNRLENVADFLKIPAKEHRLDSEIWQRAKLGDEKSLKYVWEHNKEDVITLEGVYEKLKYYTKNSKTSI